MTARLLLGMLLVFFFTSLGAQPVSNINPAVNIIGGEAYYLHEVIDGQDLHAIAKAYFTTEESIRAHNALQDDSLSTGQRLRIPYTDESARQMSEMAEEDLRKKLEDHRRQTLAQDQPSAVSPAASEHRSDDSSANPTELDLLKELAGDVDQSLSELKAIGEEIDQKPVLDDDGLIREEIRWEKTGKVEASGKPVSLMLAGMADTFIHHPTRRDTNLYLREYFLLRFDQRGIVTNVRDERTLTNHNTHYFNPETLKGRHISDSSLAVEGMIVPLGLNLSLSKRFFHVKARRNKIRFLDKGKLFRDMEEMNRISNEIMAYCRNNGLRGKQTLVVTEGDYYLSVHDRFEYNPFAKTHEIIQKVEFFGVDHVEKK